MKCRAGDIALWVSCGVLVEVVSLSFHGEIYKSTCGAYRVRLSTAGSSGPAWRVRLLGSPLVWEGCPGVFQDRSVYDSGLIPLRDRHGDDETLAWAGKPEQVTA